MSQRLRVLIVCGLVVVVAKVVASFDGPWVLAASAIGVVGFVVVIVQIRRQYQRERPKPPWPPDPPQAGAGD